MSKDKRILYHDADGVLQVVIPAIDDMAEVINRSIPPGIDYKIVDVSELPEDRHFRDAWVLAGTEKKPKIHCDMDKAREIQRNYWRRARTPLLKALDVEFQKATEDRDGDLQDKIAAKKKALRDVTKTGLSHIKHPEDLKDFWPDVLNG